MLLYTEEQHPELDVRHGAVSGMDAARLAETIRCPGLQLREVDLDAICATRGLRVLDTVQLEETHTELLAVTWCRLEKKKLPDFLPAELRLPELASTKTVLRKQRAALALVAVLALAMLAIATVGPGLWAAAVDATDWGRGWGLQATPSDGSPPRLVGHIELQVSFPPTAHHRANMGMGLERGFRGRGQGRALLTTAIEWARAEPSLRWMDLGVFGGNERAIALYERFGFREVGRTAERFLVDGRPVEDISMTLFIGPGQRATAPA